MHLFCLPGFGPGLKDVYKKAPKMQKYIYFYFSINYVQRYVYIFFVKLHLNM